MATTLATLEREKAIRVQLYICIIVIVVYGLWIFNEIQEDMRLMGKVQLHEWDVAYSLY